MQYFTIYLRRFPAAPPEVVTGPIERGHLPTSSKDELAYRFPADEIKATVEAVVAYLKQKHPQYDFKADWVTLISQEITQLHIEPR